MYIKDSQERDDYYKSRGYMDRNKAHNIWKKQNPNASYGRRKRAEWLLKYNVSVNSGLLMKPEDFG